MQRSRWLRSSFLVSGGKGLVELGVPKTGGIGNGRANWFGEAVAELGVTKPRGAANGGFDNGGANILFIICSKEVREMMPKVIGGEDIINIILYNSLVKN